MAILKESFIDIENLLQNNKINSVLILGDQTFNRSIIHYPDLLFNKYKNYKEFLVENYKNIKFDVLDIQGSIDINLNLNDIHYLENKYDLIIDSGTSEHVDNQYSYIINVNNWLNDGGFYYTISIDHSECVVTNQTQWLDHCFYFYDINYFNFIKECFNWEIVDYKHGYIEDATKPLNFCLFTKNKHFIDESMIKKIYEKIHLNLNESEVTILNMSNLKLAKEFIKKLNSIS